jgi:prevent-host-death family protein
MTTMTISELRADISKVVNSVKKTPVTISRHGEAVAVIISTSMYEQLLDALEELEDIAAYDAAVARNEPTFAYEQVRKELGLI